MNHRLPSARQEDRGAALLLAVGAIAVVALLGAVLLADARNEINQSARLVDRAEADSILDLAVAGAWDGIINGATRAFSDSGEASSGPWSFTATPVATHRWEVTVDAGRGTAAVSGRVTIARDALLPYSLLVEDATTGPLRGRVTGRVGIRGTAAFSGRSLGDVQELIGPAASCVGCSDPIVVEFGVDPPAAPGSLPAQLCPAVGGVITGALAGGATYHCDDPGPLTLTGAITVSGPIVLEIGPDVELSIDAAALNVGGDPVDFVVSQPTTSGSAISVTDSRLDGLLLAPESRFTTAGFTWEGMVVVGELATSSGSVLSGAWTADLESLGLGGWRITSWHTERN